MDPNYLSRLSQLSRWRGVVSIAAAGTALVSFVVAGGRGNGVGGIFSMFAPTLNAPVALVGQTSRGSDATGALTQMLLGNPDNAAPSLQKPDHYLLARPLLALSYNDKLRFPNWVSWHLSAGDIGSAERGQFQPDLRLPETFTRVTPGDYTGSGYDRGHNCPSKDRSASRAENDQAFLMSNITPQAPGLNQGPWAQLEGYCRTLTEPKGRGSGSGRNELYITCGHSFSAPTHKSIGRAGIAVPDFGWKIIVVLPEKNGDDLARITAKTRVIAVRMPNINTVSKQQWTRYIVSVADIEKATGLHFFDALPKDVAEALKAQKDTEGGGRQTPPPFAGGKDQPTPPSSGNTPAPGATAGQVWVNLNSGVFWREGTRYYGKTKQGKYMSEADAIKAGYRAAKGP